mgnify:CR=1 FL=1
MEIRDYKNLLYILILILGSSCVGGKYIYEFDTGKNLDFGNGKWIFNEVQSNSEMKNNKRLYAESYEEIYHW